jgi:hypothetical protein
MLRRVRTVFRGGLLVLGAALIVSIPISYYVSCWINSPRLYLSIVEGVLVVQWTEARPRAIPEVVGVEAGAQYLSMDLLGDVSPLWLSSKRVQPPANRGRLMLYFPLWLLAALCLSWPVTSFAIDRRRRGFEVEAKHQGPLRAPDS